ncbi:MAG: hypothetical protein E7Z91_06420 [Cyanobacteria bacterium SIG30]|nr:hypothetical protein [Cyanobacteria bacterium SIG30]
MFDFNSNLTPDNKEIYEMLPYLSSVNVCAGLYTGKATDILKFAEYATKNEIAIGVLVNLKNTNNDEEIKSDVIYQISAVEGFLTTFGLKIENVRLEGESYNKFNSDKDFAIKVANAIKHVNPWFNIILNNAEIKTLLEKELSAKCALEADFTDKTSIRELREKENVPETLHFENLDNLKRAYDVLKPTPITYNRVAKGL